MCSISQLPPQPWTEGDLVWVVLGGPPLEDSGRQRTGEGREREGIRGLLKSWLLCTRSMPGTLWLFFRIGKLSRTYLPCSMYWGRLVEPLSQACKGSFESHLTDQKAETQRSVGFPSQMARSARGRTGIWTLLFMTSESVLPHGNGGYSRSILSLYISRETLEPRMGFKFLEPKLF